MSWSAQTDLTPFLETAPPAWAARALATVLLAIFGSAALVAAFVSLPEAVSAPFVLLPMRGADPVRAFRSGIVAEVHGVEGRTIAAGEPLLTIASSSVGDRAAEWQALASQIEGVQDRLENRRQQDASRRLADEQEAHRIEERLESLARAMDVRRQQLAAAREMAKRQRETFDLGLSSWMEMIRVQIEADRLALELEQAQAERAEARRSLERLRHESAARRAEAREDQRGLLEELERARIRRSALDQEAIRAGNQLVAEAPCTGVVSKLLVRSRGAVVQEGDVLAEVACGGESLQAELTLPQEGMGLVQPGQSVRLLCDAFPYQRYGALVATIRWVSPASADGRFRAFADLESDAVRVEGHSRSLAPGMGGRARVVIGRRTLVSFALGPIRALREGLGAPLEMKEERQ